MLNVYCLSAVVFPKDMRGNRVGGSIDAGMVWVSAQLLLMIDVH